MTWPRKIFIESTALFQLGPRVENVDLARLIELRDFVSARLYVTEVNWLEYLRFRKRDLRDVRNRLVSAKKDLGKYGLSPEEIDPILNQIDSLLDCLEAHFRDKFQSLGIHILPVTSIDPRRLLTMSIDGTPPFEKPREQGSERSTEKGFRDALTMFTIMQETRDGTDDHPLVITKDDLLTESFALHSGEFNTQVSCVDGFAQAIKHIEGRLSAAYRESLRRESEEAKRILMDNQSALERKVAEIRELSSSDLGVLFGLVKDDDGQNLSVDRVLSVEFQEIESAIWKETGGSTSRILFRMKCRARLLATRPYNMLLDYLPTYPIGGNLVTSGFLQSKKNDQQEKTISVWFYGQAVFDRAYGGWTLKDLQIDRTMPDPEDIFELIRLRGEETK
jgi:hypothetical protein